MLQAAHHNVGDEGIQAGVAAGAALTADADELHELAGRCAGHIHAQAVQVGLAVLQRLPPVPACSQQHLMSRSSASVALEQQSLNPDEA